MKKTLTFLAAAVLISLASGCVTVKKDAPTSTRTTTVATPAVSSTTTTY